MLNTKNILNISILIQENFKGEKDLFNLKFLLVTLKFIYRIILTLL